jgi:hypothetical protein
LAFRKRCWGTYLELSRKRQPEENCAVRIFITCSATDIERIRESRLKDGQGM